MSIDEDPRPGVPAPSAGYEFKEAENKVFSGLSGNSRRVGFWFEIYGGLLLLSFVFGLIPKQIERLDVKPNSGLTLNMAIPRIDLKDGVVSLDFSSLISGLVFMMMGNWSRRAAWGFESVAKTQGGDIGHLMSSLKELSRLYGLLRLIISIVVFVLAIVYLFAMLAALSSVSKVPS